MEISKEEARDAIDAAWPRAENVVVTDMREATGGIWHAWTSWTVDGYELTDSIRLAREQDLTIKIL